MEKKGIVNPNLILTIHTSLDIPRLNEVHHMMFNLLNRPTECSTHSIKFNGSERLEIKNHSAVPDKVRQVMYVLREVNVYGMSCLENKKTSQRRERERE